MKVLIVRHAEAEAKGPGKADLERQLTAAGVKMAQAVGQTLAELFPSVRYIVSSLAVRSIQTAEAISGSFTNALLVKSGALNPGATWEQYKSVIAEAPNDADTIVLVGHEPDISQAIGALIGAAHARLRVAKLACVELEISESGDAELVALLPPEFLTRETFQPKR